MPHKSQHKRPEPPLVERERKVPSKKPKNWCIKLKGNHDFTFDKKVDHQVKMTIGEIENHCVEYYCCSACGKKKLKYFVNGVFIC